MKKITLNELLNLYYISLFSNKTNKINLYFKKEYSKFFDSKTSFKFEDFIYTKNKLNITNYSKIHENTVLLIKKIILSESKNEKFKDLDFFDDKILLPILIDAVAEKKEVFYISDEDYIRLYNYFITAYFYDRQRFSFLILKKEVLKNIPENIHSEFNDLHEKINGKRLTGSTISSFVLLRDYFDIPDERFDFTENH